MLKSFSTLLDWLSEFIAARKGLLPLIGILLVVANFLVVIFSSSWLATSNLLLHLGVILAILGFLLAWAL
jgi:hypothetical protein